MNRNKLYYVGMILFKISNKNVRKKSNTRPRLIRVYYTYNYISMYNVIMIH